MPVDDSPTTPEVKDDGQENRADGTLSRFVSEVTKLAGRLSGSSDTATSQLVSEGKLPGLELNDRSETKGDETAASADARVGLARHKGLPQSEAMREAKAEILSPESSQEEKLEAAAELARMGERTFTGPDGRRYDISLKDYGGRALVSIHTDDSRGNSHPVLRGVVQSDGSLSKQRDADGQEVPYEGSWAARNLKDSPLVGAGEKAETVPPSAEREHMLSTLKEKGLEPPSQSYVERRQLADEHGQLEQKFGVAMARYEAVKKVVDARNKPLQEEDARLDRQIASLEEQQGDAAAVGRKNQELATNLKEAGIGDGTTFKSLDDPETFRQIREQIDSKVADPQKREQLKGQVDELEKMEQDWSKLQDKIEKLYEKRGEIGDKIEENKAPLYEAGREVGKVRKELYANEAKLQEGKFAEDLKEIDKLPQEKREAIYKSMEQIANDAGGPPNNLSPEQRQKLIEQVAHQIANPESINQGNKGTCGIASTEFELANNHPEKYAKYVADLATKGETVLADGRTMKVDPEVINVRNDKGELKPHDDGNRDRGLASKIFQTAGANLILEERAASKSPPEEPSRYVTDMPGSLKYPIPMVIGTQLSAGTRDFRPSEDTGERIIAPDGDITHWDGVDNEEIGKLTSSLTGQEHEAKPVVKGRDLSDPAQAAEAQKDFIDLVESNGVPVKVSITAMKGDFTGMNMEGGHELIITRVDKGPPAAVYYENTAGGADHSYPTGRPVPLSTFLKSMQETRMSDGNVHVEGYIIGKK